jgi:hypothetical protein
MVDFCRPSSLPGNNTLGSGNSDNNNNNNNNSKDGNSNFFPSVFVSIFFDEKRNRECD